MKTRQWNNPKRLVAQPQQSLPNALMSSSDITLAPSVKETQYTSSQKPSLLERLEPQNLLEILTLEDWDQERTLTDMDEQREGGQERPGLDVNLGPHKRTERSDEGVHRHLKINPECFPWAVSDRVEGSTM
jgi:hypothetical protein